MHIFDRKMNNNFFAQANNVNSEEKEVKIFEGKN